MPIDPWDVLVPWLAWQDDLLIAAVLLKLLHKYGAAEGEELRTPADVIRKLLNKEIKPQPQRQARSGSKLFTKRKN